MQPLNTSVAATLQWFKPSWRKQQYELRDGAAVVATLTINGWMNAATGATMQAIDRLQRVGFWKQHITINDGTTGAPLATYVPHWSGSRGELTFVNGEVYRRTQHGFWRPETEWIDAQGQWLCRATANWQSKMRVTLNPETAARPALGLLLVLTQYLMAVAATEAATVAATTVTSG